jgi:1,4-dihydroxy-2-naphthoyl-CoA synthase
MFNNDSNNLQYWKCAGPVTTITLNRPECRNALDHEVSAELNAAVKEISVDGGCRIVILRGAGDTFCAPVMTRRSSTTGSQRISFGMFALNPKPRLKPRFVLTVRQYDWAGHCPSNGGIFRCVKRIGDIVT